MSAPLGTIRVMHGKTVVDVPRDLFSGDEAVVDEEKAAAFRDMIGGRYPWLSQGSLDVLMNKARTEMKRILDEESHGQAGARILHDKGDLRGAIRHMREWAEREPDNSDIWYTLARFYTEAGDKDAAFKAMNRGRSLI